MKSSLLSFALLVTIYAHSQPFFEESKNFFEKYVSKGWVDYQGIINNQEELDELLNIIATYPIDEASSQTEKAFLINAYNILVIKGIIDDYPTKSPLDIPNYFDEAKYTVAGQKVSLNQLEKGMLYPKYPDPRLHFVLVCAAVSCPKLQSTAYFPAQLESQLTEVTKSVLNDEQFIQNATTKPKLSIIFSWYEGDFGGRKNLINFINQYRDNPLPVKTSIKFYEYDWTLNESK